MRNLVWAVMDDRLRDLFALWRASFDRIEGIDDPLRRLSSHADHLLVIDVDGAQTRYGHYGRAFVEHFGTDLTGRVIDGLPTEILPPEQRGMLAFEYAFARRLQRPLWRSYTARFAHGQTETWQRLVLPAGGDRLVVGAYPRATGADGAAAGADPSGLALLRLLIERVPVVIDENGEIQDLALSLRIFSDTQQQVAELEALATRDALTGIANLRHFHHLASAELDHAGRMGRALSVLALDLDHFKQINDNWGHAIGDEALQAFVGACRLSLREPDILGRCGGEEFAVALPNTGSAGARVIAERLRRQVEDIQLPLPQGQVLRFTVSIGVATATADENRQGRVSIRSLLARADAALYRSKAEGRNRVTVGTGDVPIPAGAPGA